MTKLKVWATQKGFTLIELMIVVAIIGVLVAIAAPNFARYQAKARQAEAKLALGGIYAGEKSFYAEYAAYVAGLTDIGYSSEGSKRFYSIGWSSATAAASITGYSVTPSTASLARINFPAAWTDCTLATLSATPAGATLDPQSFIAVATGQLNDGNAVCDGWEINDLKSLLNKTIGL